MAKKQATRKNPPRMYAIGYEGDSNCVYGPDDERGRSTYIDKMTLAEAVRDIKTLSTPGASKVIYRLVPIKLMKNKAS